METLTPQVVRDASAGWLMANADRLDSVGLLPRSVTPLRKMNADRRYGVYKRLLAEAQQNAYVTVSEYLEATEKRQRSPLHRFLVAVGLA